MSRRALRTVLAASLAATALVFAGCASSAPAPAETTDGLAESDFVTPGKLTIATGDIAYEPYVLDDDPASGEGFEAALGYAIAEQLGFEPDNVEWVRTSFEAAIAPGPKNFDFNIQQYTITEERRQAVDFSSPYYSASQAVVALKGGPAEGIDTIEGLQGITLGAMAGSTSAQTIEEVIAPTVTPQFYSSNEDAVAALNGKQIDAFVIDLPTAYAATTAYIENSFIVGELPLGDVPDEWGVVLPKDSALTGPVTAAIDELRTNGTLDELTEEWLGVLQEGVILLK